VPLNVLSWDRGFGVDYTVTATKTFKFEPVPFAGTGGVLGGEQDWHGVNLGIQITRNLCADVGVLFLGDLGNSPGNGALSLRVAWPF